MAFFSWDTKYSVNVPDLDKEHKILLEMLNELHDAMKQGKGKENIERLVNNSASYAKSHLSHEERLMEQCGYPGFQEHKKQHEFFVQKVNEFKNDVNQNNYKLSSELLKFLKDWFVNHITMVDSKYSTSINNCKVK
ncbi:bacteriohemerythrin [Heliobacterium gestii]|uniref:Bacteriohemerythrin n=1 Tax=Heliomicrobium gestii TaxID=2699 RepID=A0A845L9T0_HELGE|nr:bacteriohemerythrin [Heliomicrobium gestii]MBM7866914.1 hemerythrin [Heliomicrobium gestii]MZP42341.1 bacteriohemerythrin [Heliomicrobium gestii]